MEKPSGPTFQTGQIIQLKTCWKAFFVFYVIYQKKNQTRIGAIMFNNLHIYTHKPISEVRFLLFCGAFSQITEVQDCSFKIQFYANESLNFKLISENHIH